MRVCVSGCVCSDREGEGMAGLLVLCVSIFVCVGVCVGVSIHQLLLSSQSTIQRGRGLFSVNYFIGFAQKTQGTLIISFPFARQK